MDEHGIDVHCLVPLPWLECEPAVHADEAKALKVKRKAVLADELFTTKWDREKNRLLFVLHALSAYLDEVIYRTDVRLYLPYFRSVFSVLHFSCSRSIGVFLLFP